MITDDGQFSSVRSEKLSEGKKRKTQSKREREKEKGSDREKKVV